MCKKMLELKNELEIQKKGKCKCSCIPTSFKISKNDKNMNIDKTKDHPIIMKMKRKKLLNQ